MRCFHFHVGRLSMKIKFGLLFITACCFILLGLGSWQLKQGLSQSLALHDQISRQQKKLDEKTYLEKSKNASDLQFYQIQLQGFFDNQHAIFLDQSNENHETGYEVFSPFYVPQLEKTFLIDRGFISISDRKNLPELNQIIGSLTLNGLLVKPKPALHKSMIINHSFTQWPLQIESLDLNPLSQLLHTPLAPYLVKLKPQDPLGYHIIWQAPLISPEKHYLYALQWFALASILVVSCFVFRKKR